MTEKEEKAIEYVKEFIEELQCDINMFGFEDDCEEEQNLLIEQRDNFSTILKALEQKDKEIEELKKYDYRNIKLDEKDEVKSPSFTKEQLNLMNLGIALYKSFDKLFNDKGDEEGI